MKQRAIISLKENKLQEDCFMYELKQLMKKYGLVSLGTKQGAITIIDDSISANGMHFEIQENVFDQKQKCDFTPCFMEEYFKV